MMSRVLVVDDEAALTNILGVLLRKHGYDVTVCATGQSAVAAYERSPHDVVLLDYALPDLNGTDVFERLRRLDPRVVCIYMTAFGSIRSAVDAIKGGAVDYLAKPFDNDELLATVARAVKLRRLSAEGYARQGGAINRGLDGLITVSAAMRAVGEALGRIVDIDATVIILGDGRSNFADPRLDLMNLIHQRSRAVIWLNPEPESYWGQGDSVMYRYARYCHVAKQCNSLAQLERIIEDVLRTYIPH